MRIPHTASVGALRLLDGISQSALLLSEFFSHFICHLQGFCTYYSVTQYITGLQIPLADGLQIKYLQGYMDMKLSHLSNCNTSK